MAQSTRDRLSAAEALGLDTAPVQVDIKVPVPEVVPSDPQLDEQAAKEGAGFLASGAASLRVDNSGYALYQDFTDPRFSFDSSFDGGEYVKEGEVRSRIDALTLADTEELYALLGGAANRDHAEFLMTRFESKQEDELKIASGGGLALMARLGANVFDPIDIGITLAATAVTGVGGAALKARKWGRIITAAGTAGLSNAAIEAYIAQDNPFRDELDVAFAGAAGIVMGGSLSYLTRGENLRMERIANQRARTVLDDSVGSRRRAFDGSTDPDTPTNLSPTGEAHIDEILDGDAPDFKYKAMDSITTNLRGKIANATEATRNLFGRMMEGGFVERGLTRRATAEGEADALERSLGVKFMAPTEQHFKAWADKEGYGYFRRMWGVEAGERFYTDVSHAIRGIDDINGRAISSEAKAAANEMNKVLSEIYDIAGKAGVKGFDAVPLENFFPRIYSKPEFNRWINRLGKDNNEGEATMRQFFKEAIIDGQDDIGEELAEIFSRSMVRTMRRSSSGIDQQLVHGIPLDDADKLREVLTAGLKDEDLSRAIEDVDQIMEVLARIKDSKSADAGKIDRVKRRVRLNEGYSGLVVTRDGERVNLNFTDLLQNDARGVGMRYIQVLAGHIGLAKHANIKSKADFDLALKGIKSRGEMEGRTSDELARETGALQRGYDLLTGKSVEADPMGMASKLSRTIRDVNFVRSSGAFGVAQLAEYGNLIATATIRSFGRHIPEFLGLARRAADGTLDNNVARQLEEWFGPGTDFIRHPALRGFDEFGEGFDSGAGRLDRFMQDADVPIQVGKRAASVMSLMGPIITRMEKQMSIAHIFEFTDIAMKKGTKLSDAKTVRWQGAGLDPAMQTRVLANMQKHAKWDKNGRLTDMGVEKWDYDVADSYHLAVRRQASFTAQRNDIADLPESIRGPAGRLIWQFKSFMFGSIVKQLERGIHYRDIETFVAFSASMFVASMGYVGQTYLETVGNPEKRAEKLTMQNVIGAGFARAGWTALLVPPAATFADLLGYDEMFNHRTSGLQASLLTLDQNPTMNLIGSVLGTAGAATFDNLDPDTRGINRKDAQRALNILPYNRVLGIKNALHLIDE